MADINTYTMSVHTPKLGEVVASDIHKEHACNYRCKGGFKVACVRHHPARGLQGSSFEVQCTGSYDADCNVGDDDRQSGSDHDQDEPNQTAAGKKSRSRQCCWFMILEWVRDVQDNKHGWAVRDMNLTHSLDHHLLVDKHTAMYSAATRAGHYALREHEDEAIRLRDECNMTNLQIHKFLSMKAAQQHKDPGWELDDVKKLLTKTARVKKHDLTKLHQYVLQRKAEHLCADVLYDEDDTLIGVFVEMRGAYEVAKKYGGGSLVATIDTTHETNAYGFKLADVVATDHNNMIRCMAVALIKTENVPAFRFVLANFKQCFGEPGVLMSDSDACIAVAITIELPHTTHLLCVFHLLMNLRTNVRSLFKIDAGYAKAWDKILAIYWKLVYMTDSDVLSEHPDVVNNAFEEMRVVIREYAASKQPCNASARSGAKEKKSGQDKALDMIQRLQENQSKFVGVHTWAVFSLGRHASSNSESWHSLIKPELVNGNPLLHDVLVRIDAKEASRAQESRKHDLGLSLPESQRKQIHQPTKGFPPWMTRCEQMLTYHGISMLQTEWQQMALYKCEVTSTENYFTVTRIRAIQHGTRDDDRVPGVGVNLDCFAQIVSGQHRIMAEDHGDKVWSFKCSAQCNIATGTVCRHILCAANYLYVTDRMTAVHECMFASLWRRDEPTAGGRPSGTQTTLPRSLRNDIGLSQRDADAYLNIMMAEFKQLAVSIASGPRAHDRTEAMLAQIGKMKTQIKDADSADIGFRVTKVLGPRRTTEATHDGLGAAAPLPEGVVAPGQGASASDGATASDTHACAEPTAGAPNVPPPAAAATTASNTAHTAAAHNGAAAAKRKGKQKSAAADATHAGQVYMSIFPRPPPTTHTHTHTHTSTHLHLHTHTHTHKHTHTYAQGGQQKRNKGRRKSAIGSVKPARPPPVNAMPAVDVDSIGCESHNSLQDVAAGQVNEPNAGASGRCQQAPGTASSAVAAGMPMAESEGTQHGSTALQHGSGIVTNRPPQPGRPQKRRRRSVGED